MLLEIYDNLKLIGYLVSSTEFSFEIFIDYSINRSKIRLQEFRKQNTVEELKRNKLARTQMEDNLRETNGNIKGYILPRCTGILQALISYYIRTSTFRCCSNLLVP